MNYLEVKTNSFLSLLALIIVFTACSQSTFKKPVEAKAIVLTVESDWVGGFEWYHDIEYSYAVNGSTIRQWQTFHGTATSNRYHVGDSLWIYYEEESPIESRISRKIFTRTRAQ